MIAPRSILVLFGSLGFATAAPAHAGSGDTMTITATVLPSCSLEAGGMAFGTIDGNRPQGTAEAALTLQCTPGTAYAVTMDQGQNGARRMANVTGGGFLDYEIYRDAAGTRPWGGAAGSAISGVASGPGKISLAAYGRVVSSTVTPGQYQDVVTVTVEF